MSSIDTIQTNYNDDFDPDKKFHRILYKPGRAVQARELIQQQTILQNQIERFGTHMFKEGTIVLGGAFDQQNGVNRVDVTILTDNVTIDQFVRSDVVGQITGIRANVIHATFDEETNIASFFIRYKDANEFYDKFEQNETLIADNAIAAECRILDDPSALGKGSIFTIERGVMFFRGFFIQFDRETIVMDPSSSAPSAQIALKANFKVVTPQEDTSLLDNARDTPNYTAPGADRLAVESYLVRLDFDQESKEDESVIYVTLEGDVWETKERTQYNRIYEELAARTYDESGDYTVRGMKTFTREHLNTGSNEGMYTAEKGGNPDLLAVGIESGTSYVKGYEVNNLVTKYINIPKSKKYEQINNQIVYARSGTHVLVKELTGAPTAETGSLVEFYDAAEQRETNQITYSTTPTGTKVGEAKIRSVLVQRTEDDLYLRVFFFDIKLEPNRSVEEIQSLSTNAFFADVDPDEYGNIIRDQQAETLIVPAGNNSVRAVRSSDDTIDTSYSSSKSFDATADSSGMFSISTTGNQTFPYGTGEILSIGKNRILVVVDDLVNVPQTGTISSSGNTITGSGTAFLSTLNVGEKLETGTGTIVVITEINSDFELTVTTSQTFSGETFSKKFIYGDPINMNGNGSNGAKRSIVANTTSLAFELHEAFGANVPVKVISPVSRNTAQEAAKVVKKRRFVQFDVSGLTNTARLNLGLADVMLIRQIRLSSSPFTSRDEGTNVTNSFKLKSGQLDTFYDHAYLEVNMALAAGDYLLVELDYFEPSYTNGYGYFSVDSYPINDEVESDNTIFTYEIPFYKSKASGGLYVLRDCLDFRPMKANTAVDSTTVSGASINPPTTTNFSSSAFTFGVPIPGSQITFDYSFYLARRDIITVNSEGKIAVEMGEASTNPRFPTVGDEVMALAQIMVPPFPSISSTYARILGNTNIGTKSVNISNRRYSMKDIGVLDKRIKNLEYYNALNLLEKKAVDMTIQDENGLERFKNGYFVDGFIDHSLGATYNPDYNISVDKKRELIRPKFENDNFSMYKIADGGGLQKSGKILTVPYTETLLFEQPNVTTFRNIEQSIYRFIGNMHVDPPHDMWVDDTVVDKTINMDFGSNRGTVNSETRSVDSVSRSSSTSDSNTETDTVEGATITRRRPTGMSGEVWNSWETNHAGYNVYEREPGDTSGIPNGDLIGTFDTYEEAQNAANTTTTVSTGGFYGGTGEGGFGGLGFGGQVQLRDRTLIEDLGSTETRTGTRNSAGVTDTTETSSTTTTVTNNTERNVDFNSTNSTYTSVNSTSNTQTLSEELGTFVTDTSLIPYIRPQMIRLFCRGMKANTRFFVFFDGEDMNDYVTPYKVPEESGDVDAAYPVGAEGDNLRSDKFGELICYLRLPRGGKRFRVGTKDIKITDSPTNANDPSSYAEGEFHAQGLKQNRQNTILSASFTTVDTHTYVRDETRTNTTIENNNETIIDTDTETDTTTTTTPGSSETISETRNREEATTEIVGPSCMAYSFLVEAPKNEAGVFMTSVDVFIQSLHPTLGVWFEIREMSNDGNITRTQVPYSEVWMKRDDPRLNTSEDGTVPTTVNFESPVFLYNDIEYAFVIHTEGLNPDTYFFVSRLGEDDLRTGDQVTSRKLTGNVYTTNNNLNWDMVPDLDLTVRFNRAKFTTKTNFVSRLNNEDVEFIEMEEEPFPFFNEGESVVGSDKITLSNISGGAIPLDAYLVGQTSGTRGKVVQVDTNTYFTDARGFEEGETVVAEDDIGTLLGVTASVSVVKYGKAIVLKVRDEENRLNLTKSNGEFFVGSVISNEDGSITFPISAFRDYKFSVMRFTPSSISFKKSAENYSVSSRDALTNGKSNFKRLPKLKNYTMDTVKTLLSKSVEKMDFNGEKSLDIKTNLFTLSEYTSPVVDYTIANSIFVRNKINDDVTGEDGVFGGNLINKYISKVVSLARGQDGQDLNVFLTSYRPPGSDIKVWVKLRHRAEIEASADKEWIEMYPESNVISQLGESETFYEDSFIIPRELMVGPEGEYQYISDGSTFNGFAQFDVKIGLVGNEYNVNVPKVKDIRAIVLQM